MITVLTTASALGWLETERLLPGVLLRLQLELRTHRMVGLRIVADGGPSALEMTTAATATEGFSAVALRTRDANRRQLAPDVALTIRAGGCSPQPDPLRKWEYEDVLAELAAGSRSGTEWGAESAISTFLEAHHIDDLQTTVPWSGAPTGPVLLVLAPWLRTSDLGSMPTLVRAVRKRHPDLAVHLVLTSRSVVDAEARPALSLFDTVTPLAGADEDAAERILPRLMSGADVVLHAGTHHGLLVLPRLNVDERGRQAVLATATSSGIDVDAPELLAARCYEPLIDAYLATSPDAASTLAGLQAVPDKIFLVPPTVNPAHGEALDTAAIALLGGIEVSA